MDGLEFKQLVKTFQSLEALPQLPESSIRLVQTCESEGATLQDAEKIVASDPGLATTVIRAASTARFFGMGGPTTSVSSAVMRLGLRALKALAMTYTFRALLDRRHGSEHYDPRPFSKHSVFVGIGAQYLYDRECGHLGHDLEEVFAFGLLHDLGACLLANVAPELFDELWIQAQNGKISLEERFYMKFKEPMVTIAWAAATAWDLPELFTEYLHAMTKRAEPSDLQQVCQLIETVSLLSETQSYGFEAWLPGENRTDLDEKELPALKRAVDDYCAQVFDIPLAA